MHDHSDETPVKDSLDSITEALASKPIVTHNFFPSHCSHSARNAGCFIFEYYQSPQSFIELQCEYFEVQTYNSNTNIPVVLFAST